MTWLLMLILGGIAGAAIGVFVTLAFVSREVNKGIGKHFGW